MVRSGKHSVFSGKCFEVRWKIRSASTSEIALWKDNHAKEDGRLAFLGRDEALVARSLLPPFNQLPP